MPVPVELLRFFDKFTPSAAAGDRACTASELDTGLPPAVWLDEQSGEGSRFVSLRLLYLITIRELRLAATAEPQPRVQGPGDHGPAPRSLGAAPSGRPAQA